jgi:hypothetical protein
MIHPSGLIKCLADCGYVGNNPDNHCLDQNIELVVQPKKKRNGLMTHTLTPKNKILLKKHRSSIEPQISHGKFLVRTCQF